VLTTRELATEVPDRLGLAVTAAPAARLSDAQRHLGTSTDFFGSDRPASIAANASVHASATVAPRNVVIGAGCIIEAGAVVLERSVLEDGVVIRAGAVIGAEGFHPIPHDEGIVNLSHCGGVHLGPGVQVLSGAVVCRSTFGGTTEVGARTILGPLVYVAHGVSIGTDCRIAAASRVSGSTAVGHRVYVGPGAVISNGLRVGDDARVSIGAVVVKDVPAGAAVSAAFLRKRAMMSGQRGLGLRSSCAISAGVAARAAGARKAAGFWRT